MNKSSTRRIAYAVAARLYEGLHLGVNDAHTFVSVCMCMRVYMRGDVCMFVCVLLSGLASLSGFVPSS